MEWDDLDDYLFQKEHERVGAGKRVMYYLYFSFEGKIFSSKYG